MPLQSIEELILKTRDGKTAGRMKLWIDDEQVVIREADEEEEIVFDEELVLLIHEILDRHDVPISAQAIRKIINRDADYRLTDDDAVKNVLENVLLKAGVVGKDRGLSVQRYYLVS